MKLTHSFCSILHLAFALAMALILLLSPPANAQAGWGSALRFDGVDDLVHIPNFGSAMPTNEVTVEFWLNVDAPKTQAAFALGPDQSANRFLAHVPHIDGTIYWDFGNISAGGRISYLPSAGITNAWHHFALVASRSGNFMRIYRNGVLEASKTGSGAFTRGVYDLLLGGSQGYCMSGWMDDFRIWNAARTQPEIARDMLRPLTGLESNLLAYWKFDELEGTTVSDSTTNHHDGVLTNGTARVSSSISAPNLVVNPGFEVGTWPWYPFGPSSIMVTNIWPHSGTNCGYVCNRTETWQGIVQFFEGVLQPGLTYHISGWVRLANSDSARVDFTFLQTERLAGVTNTSYIGVTGGTVTSNQWTQLRGSFTFNLTGELVRLGLWVAGPPVNVNFFLDDFVITPEVVAAPQVTLLPPSGLSGTPLRATLNGKVLPNGLPTTVWFEWGTNWANYDHATLPAQFAGAWDPLAINGALSGLTDGGLYHYRLVATNSAGVTRSANHMFCLPAISLNGPNVMTNECHLPCVDPGVTVQDLKPAIAAGVYHSLAFMTDGTVVGWGRNDNGQANGAVAGSNVVAVASGGYHCLALKTDGSVVGWGYNYYDEDNGTIAGSNVVAIAAGVHHSLALKADGTVIGWGYNGTDQTNGFLAGSNVVAIAAGGYHSLALKADGTVVGWGYNGFEQANGGVAGSNVVAIAAGLSHSLALKADGTVVGWGYNNFEQANGFLAGSNVVAIAAGLSHSLALKADGTVVSWGNNNFEQANGGVAGSNLVAVAGGGSHSLALKADGTVVSWGNNDHDQTNVPAGLNLNLPVFVTGTVNTNSPGLYGWTYRTTNSLGAAATATRLVRIVDSLPPELTLLGANPLVLSYRAPFLDPGATATDLCSGDLTASILVTGSVNPNQLGAYNLNYNVTDASGHNVTTNRTVLVMTKPSFTHGDSDGDGIVDQGEFDAVARNYWGPTSRPCMTNLVTDGQGLFQLTLTNAAAWNFTVEVSTNLVDWTYLSPAWPLLQFYDPAATNQPQRYYRLAWP